MTNQDATVRRVRAGLENEPRVNLHRYPLKVAVVDGAVLLEGDVESIATKKLALEIAAAAPGIRGVVDRLRVAVAERRGDGAIRDSLCAFLLAETELRDCAIRVRAKGGVRTLRDVGAGRAGEIEAAVEDGVVTLEGTVISLSHKRLAGVLAWWTPGCRDVVNSLDVEPPEDDNAAEVLEALRLVLEADPTIRSEEIRASCRDYVVTLEGWAHSDEERRRAEFDAWALFAVDKVVNRIEVGAAGSLARRGPGVQSGRRSREAPASSRGTRPFVHDDDVARVIQVANRLLGSAESAAQWLDRPSVQLGGRSPRELLATADGMRRVEELLAQIDDDDRLHPAAR